jgi:neutral trehalase
MILDCTPEELEEIIYYFTVGSVNLDYRSMVLNAETMIIVSEWQALTGFMDFLLLPGLCEWVDTVDELDALLPAPSTMRRTISNFIRILL